ncbi:MULTISPECIES: class I SAM-dependent methyltransferase [Methylosinus]|uniref:Class I SAM-dependent methyltransferase n=1 Tax=Methylosinus trichosporium (strain ATCC 35070 / NCIMB 11131 / UNIQEM 75 / OB3b) TaxID=595536 RepID=A0A2D2CZ61_METT3|nr:MULTISPECIES: class I SAM-dependent methyltransferase [Methylosinus]ATQ67939.1 class I SAM-dependent methyltransferase [Methylosinus trichosporium OB3b]
MKFARLRDRILRRKPTPAPIKPFDSYEWRAPSAQNCIDLIPGWNTRFPDEYGVVAGNGVAFGDPRISWAIARYGSVDGARVLEVGPMEGAHTSLLHRRGAEITAVEANKDAFLKCLITKEIVGLPRARFHLGDCVLFLEQNETRYDLIVACGVLYHMREPLRFLQAVAARTDALYLWTHFMDDLSIPDDDSPLAQGLRQTRELGELSGRQFVMYRHSYVGANLAPAFCGGIYDDARWLPRRSIVGALETLGFDSVEFAHEATPHPNLPAFSAFARRTAPGKTSPVPPTAEAR